MVGLHTNLLYLSEKERDKGGTSYGKDIQNNEANQQQAGKSVPREL